MIGEHQLNQIQITLNNAKKVEFDNAVDALNKHQTIFLVGAGRSGLVGKFFGMRLMHLGKNAYIVSETNTPSIQAGDLLVAISGSGNTSTIVQKAKKAKKYGADVLCITANPSSEIYALSDYQITIDSRNRDNRKTDKEPVDKNLVRKTPMGTSFELSSLIYLEAIISELMFVSHISEEEMKSRHVNL